MKTKVKDSVNIKQETKNDIQELFNELFVGELSRKISDVSETANNNKDKIENLLKEQTNKINVTFFDKIDELQNSFTFMGTADDWGEDNLISFLNQLSGLIGECRKSEEKQLSILGTKWEEKNLYDSFKEIEEHISEVIRLIRKNEQETIKPEFEKLNQEITNIINNYDIIKKEFEKDGLIRELETKQAAIIQDLDEHKRIIKDTKDKLEKVDNSIQVSYNCISESQISKEELRNMFELARQNSDEIKGEIQSYVIQSKRRYVCLTCGMGFVVLMNIIMLISSLLN